MQEKKKLQINKYLFISIASICAGIFCMVAGNGRTGYFPIECTAFSGKGCLYVCEKMV